MSHSIEKSPEMAFSGVSKPNLDQKGNSLCGVGYII